MKLSKQTYLKLISKKKTYDTIYNSGFNVSQGIAKVESDFGTNQHVQDIIKFVRASKRGIIGR